MCGKIQLLGRILIYKHVDTSHSPKSFYIASAASNFCPPTKIGTRLRENLSCALHADIPAELVGRSMQPRSERASESSKVQWFMWSSQV